MHLFAAEIHHAMVLRHHIQPSFEIINGMFVQVGKEFFKDLHHSVLGLILIFEIFHAYAKYQMRIALKQLPHDGIVARLSELLKEFGIGAGFYGFVLIQLSFNI